MIRQTSEQGHLLRVAAAQIESRNGEVEANLARATALVEEAARRKAQLVVFPELMSFIETAKVGLENVEV